MPRALRVILPNDVLLRLDCDRDVSVAAVKDYALRILREDWDNPVGGYPARSSEDNGIRIARQRPEVSENDQCVHSRAHSRLILVRSGIDLHDKAIVINAVAELDILELRVSGTDHDSSGSATLNSDDCSSVRRASLKSPKHRWPEAVFHPKTAPATRANAQTQQTQIDEHERHCHHIHHCKDSRDILCLGDKHSSRPRKSTESTRTRSQPIAAAGTSAVIERDVFPVLRGALELVRRLLVIKEEAQKLVLLLRDAEFDGSAVALDRLLSPVERITTALYQADGGATMDRWRAVTKDSALCSCTALCSSLATASSHVAPVAAEAGGSAIKTLAQTVGGASTTSRGAIVMQGWVVSTEWRGIWRHQRSEYACLCDDHTFCLFATRPQCADHIFELNRSRDGCGSDTTARILKSSAPRRSLNLSEGEWAVRRAEKAARSESQQENTKATESRREAFALFDQKTGDMRLILDVASPREAEQWVHAIQTELDYSRLYARMRGMHDDTADTGDSAVADVLGGRGNDKACPSQRAVDNGGFSIPLRWLHARVDRLNGNARSERLRSRSFSQALKDLQRDRLVINGVTYLGANVECVLVTIIRQLLTLMGRSRAVCRTLDGAHIPTESSALTASDALPVVEMNAICFARQLVVSCSRTHGGGDILDTLHLMFNKERYCICPDTQQSTPVELRLYSDRDTNGSSGSIGSGQMRAEVSLSMVYKVVALDTEAHSLGGSRGDSSSSNNNTHDQVGGERRIVAVYTQRLVGAALEWREVDGSVSVAFD